MTRISRAPHYVCTIPTPKGKPCKLRVLVSEKAKHHAQHRKSRKASAKGIGSEKAFGKYLRKKYPNSLVFKTGKEAGVPDYILFNRGKLSFYEIKPRKGDSLLKRDQRDWIKKNCLQKKLNAFLVIYEKKNKKFDFEIIKLDYTKIKEYCCSSKKN